MMQNDANPIECLIKISRFIFSVGSYVTTCEWRLVKVKLVGYWLLMFENVDFMLHISDWMCWIFSCMVLIFDVDVLCVASQELMWW